MERQCLRLVPLRRLRLELLFFLGKKNKKKVNFVWSPRDRGGCISEIGEEINVVLVAREDQSCVSIFGGVRYIAES